MVIGYSQGYNSDMSFLMFMNTPTGRLLRGALGLVVLGIGAAVGGGLGVGLMVFSILPLGTAVFGVCPVNPLFGQPMRACAVPRARAKRA